MTGWVIAPKLIRRSLTFADSVQLSLLFFSFQLILFALLMSRTVTSPRIATFSFFRFEALYRERSGGIGVRLEMMRGGDRINE
jgi:hypothetical protein